VNRWHLWNRWNLWNDIALPSNLNRPAGATRGGMARQVKKLARVCICAIAYSAFILG
jgi:hypothetical protein